MFLFFVSLQLSYDLEEFGCKITKLHTFEVYCNFFSFFNEIGFLEAFCVWELHKGLIILIVQTRLSSVLSETMQCKQCNS